jgi:ribonuclease J
VNYKDNKRGEARKKAPQPAVAPPDTISMMSFGGVREIGMNLAAYKYNGKYLIADMGIGFDQDVPSAHSKVVVPDINLLEQHAEDVIGMVITHGHDDHIAGITHLWGKVRCPIYSTAFPAELIMRKTEREQESTRRMGKEVRNKWKEIKESLNVVKQGEWVQIGEFHVKFINITHSIPESSALAIRVENKTRDTVVHTGDWKIDSKPVVGDPTDTAALKELGQEGVLALVCDSTNIMDKSTDPERRTEVSTIADLERIVKEHSDVRVLISCISTNVSRMKICHEVAKRCGRKLCLVGRSLIKVHETAQSTGYWKAEDEVLRDDEGGKMPRGTVLYLCTGSQGEPGSSIERISRIPECSKCAVKVEAGDIVVFSARTILGNERALNNIINNYAEKGVRSIFPSAKNHIHVSGHPVEEDVRQMYKWTRPKYVIPVHGEPQHLIEHARVAESCKISAFSLRNGEEVALTQDGVQSIQRFDTTKLMIDGAVLLPIDGVAVREKKQLQQGLVVINAHGGGVKIDALGMHDDNTEFKKQLAPLLKKQIRRIEHSNKSYYEATKEVRDYVANWIKETENRSPVVRVNLSGKFKKSEVQIAQEEKE